MGEEELEDCLGSGLEAKQHKVCGRFQGLPEADTSFFYYYYYYYNYNFCYCINVNVHVCLYAIIINVTLLAQSVEVMRVHGTY